MTATRKPKLTRTEYVVSYRFDAHNFRALMMAVDAEEAKQRVIASFKRDAYPMERVEILGAVPRVLMEGA